MENSHEINFGTSVFKEYNGSFEGEVYRHASHLLILIVKNAKIFSRRLVQLLLLLFIPSLILPVLLLGNNRYDGDVKPSSDARRVLSDLGPCDTYVQNCLQIAYSPSSPDITAIMDYVELHTGHPSMQAFDTEADLKHHVAKHLGHVQYSVIFLPHNIYDASYIATNSTYNYLIYFNATRESTSNFNSAILTLQKTIDTGIANYLSNRSMVYNVTVDYFSSYDPMIHEVSSNTTACDRSVHKHNFNDLGTALPWVVCFGGMIYTVVLFYVILEEKNRRLFSLLRRLGVNDIVYWSSWFIIVEALLLLACIIALIVMAIMAPHCYVLQQTSFGALFLLLFISGTAFAANGLFLVSVCYSASAANYLLFLNFLMIIFTIAFAGDALNVPSLMVYRNNKNDIVYGCVLESSSYNDIFSADFVGNTFVQFIVFFMPWFYTTHGFTNLISMAQYSEYKSSDYTSPNLPFVRSGTQFTTEWIDFAVHILVAQTFVFLFLSWLCGQVVPSENQEGRSLSSLVPRFVKSAIFPPQPLQSHDVRGNEQSISETNKCVRAYKVSKTFSSVQALKEVSFSMMHGEVFVMLGHNGAGKSTLINIMTGECMPTHGCMFVCGLDVASDVAAIQQSIGICPQDDLLWEDLTAWEHMMLHAACKGIRLNHDLKNTIVSILHQVQLYEYRHQYVKTYSGGMKRRLSVALSLVGDVNIIVLDEPTTGLDPLSRRHVWNLINLVKRQKIVILTTHNMEEADYLGDTIMIMHQGRVKAIGDSLFLKKNYGKGYQVNLTLEHDKAAEMTSLLSRYLPSSSLINSSTIGTGYLSVSIAKGDVQLLPRFFQWLERSSQAKKLLKEWSISNTTLEQVFLLLCVQNNTVNYVDRRDDSDANVCPMCRQQAKTTVVMKTTSNRYIIIPNSICVSCARNDNFLLTDAEAEQIVEHRDENALLQLLERAQQRQIQMYIHDDEAKIDDLNAMEASADDIEEEEEKSEEVSPACENMPLVEQNSIPAEESTFLQLTCPHCSQVMNAQKTGAPVLDVQCPTCKSYVRVFASFSPLSMESTMATQMLAVCNKNVMLQSHQRCANICIVIFMAIMLLLLYVFSLLTAFTTRIKQCDSGYVSFDDCDITLLENHIFSGISSSLVNIDEDGEGAQTDTLKVKYFLMPSLQSQGFFYVSPVAEPTNDWQGDQPFYYGIETETSIVWSNISQTIQIPGGVYITPAAEADADVYMLDQQVNLFNTLPASGCTSISPDYYFNLTDDTATAEMSKYFASAAFECSTSCGAELGFNGTMWLAKPSGGGSTYPFAYVAYPSEDGDSDFNKQCPAASKLHLGLASSSNNDLRSTYHAGIYLNLLSNSLLQPSLSAYPIQTGYTPYGSLFFDFVVISQFASFFLTILIVIAINAYFPLVVWKLAYEKQRNIVLMLKTNGVRYNSYIYGMLFYDMFISVVLSIAMILLVVYLDISLFATAPAGLLILICIVSCYAINSLALIVMQLSFNAKLVALISSMTAVAASVAACLIIIILYEKPGEWPLALSIIPFFAQARAFYIVIMLHEATKEVYLSLLLMFVIGTGCLLLTLASDQELFLEGASLLFKWYQQKKYGTPVEDDVEMVPMHTTAASTVIPQSDEEANLAELTTSPIVHRSIDEDIAREEAEAVQYNPDQHDRAIVLKHLHHVYVSLWDDCRQVAVGDLSLSLNYGEVFGLLGPNGAGKSTTISILSGSLARTSGDIYLANQQISNSAALHQLVGVCPQFDIIWEHLTVKQHLTFQAQQKGVPSHLIAGEVQRVACAVGLDGDGFVTPAGVLSGGMRRRLSIGMSIVGDPSIIILDEPTTGLDPDNRQHIWKIIHSLRHPKRLILITTHSMEEAENLCTRIGIMALGNLRCIGTPHHLKTKYGHGFSLLVNLLPNLGEEFAAVAASVDAYVEQKCKGTLTSCVNRTRKYSLDKSVAISDIFVQMERSKSDLKILEWGLSITTLEEVFVNAVTMEM